MTTAPFPIERDESREFAGVCVVRLEQEGRPVVVLDHALIQRLEATLREVPSDARGFVLASAAPRAFVAGADLKTIRAWDDAQLDAYLAYGQRVFGMISALPCPSVAAIHGATLGGGLELAMHCDGLVACPPPAKDGAPGRPYPVGLPEAGLGLCPGWGGTNMMPARARTAMHTEDAVRRVCIGTPYTFDEAREAGLFDAVADGPSDLLSAAKRWVCEQRVSSRARDGAPARWIGRSDDASRVLMALGAVREQFGALAELSPASAVLEAIDAGLTKGWQAALDVERARLVALRHTPEAIKAIDAFFEKSAAKG